MKKQFMILVTVIFSITSLIAQSNQDGLVKGAFNNYKQSILDDKGEEAIKFVDSRTIKYYSEIIETIKTADSAKVAGLSMIDKITVFSIRHRATKEEIKAMDGPGLFKYAIKNGMVGKNSVSTNTIGDVVVEGNFAKGELIANGNPTSLFFHFYNESGEWKLDLTSLFPISNTALTQMVKESGENENDFVFMILESLTGTKPGAEIWKPVN